jgi:hypothetical protein
LNVILKGIIRSTAIANDVGSVIIASACHAILREREAPRFR